MHNNRLLNRSNTYFIELLILGVLLNGMQVVVLCMGSDKHVTIELAGHNHCHSVHKSGQLPHDSSADPEDQDTPYRPCVDVPLAPGITENFSVHNAPMTIALFVGISPSNPGMDDLGREIYTCTRLNPVFTSFYNPLSSIILIV